MSSENLIPSFCEYIDKESSKRKNKTKRTSWAELLKRTFQIDLSACFLCGGKMKFTGAVLKKADILETLTAAELSPTPE